MSEAMEMTRDDLAAIVKREFRGLPRFDEFLIQDGDVKIVEKYQEKQE